MNRRGFLASAIAAVGTLAIDPERLIWTPGAKTIFVPAAIPDDPWAELYRRSGMILESSKRFDLADGASAIEWHWIGDQKNQFGWFKKLLPERSIPYERELGQRVMGEYFSRVDPLAGVALAA